jgi:putative ABC transport system permease protein
MIVKDFKIAVRNILRNKALSTISILGLGMGLASIILLQALIINETSFDKFIPDYANVNKILLGETAGTAYPLAESMKKDFPEVVDFFRFVQSREILIRNSKNEWTTDRNFGFSDPSIFKILGIKIIAGVPANSPTEVTISEMIAKKYFGRKSAVGEILQVKINNEILDLSVSGVYKDFPCNSTLFPDFISDIQLSEKLFSAEASSLNEYSYSLRKATYFDWNNSSFYSFVVLDKKTDKQLLTSKMQKYTELAKDPKTKEKKYHLLPVRDIYLKSGSTWWPGATFRIGNASELKYYWSISFLILLISVVNYIFLTRAATAERLRELGTRKVLGASQKNLRRQIILESNLVTLLSLIPASFVIDPGMSFIGTTLNRHVTNDIFSNPLMWLSLILIVVITGTLSGLLIGFKISRISPLFLLSGKTSENHSRKKWNLSFLVLHFSLYIILVVSVITVSKQIRYAMSNFRGINPKNIIISGLNSEASKSAYPAIKSEMEKIPGVEKVTGSTFIPFLTYSFPLNLANPQGELVKFDGLIMGEGMTELLGIEVIDGSSFGPFKAPPPMDILINEQSAKKHNLKAGDNFLGVFHVRGILRDFHSHSFHSAIQPMAILQDNPKNLGLIAIKTDGKNDKAVIEKLHELYTQIAPDEIFDARYFLNFIDDLYLNDKNQARLMGAFSILATILAVMGLFGIALISIVRKTKEIGLRKVNGATVSEVVYLLNKDFIRWVVVALIIGIPVSYYLMSEWLKRFVYKTELSWWIFAVAGISAILVAVLTVSFQSWKAATRNPVEALRYE